MIEILYLLNLIVTTILVVGTLYRIKIERDMVKITIQNAKYREAMQYLRRCLKTEELSAQELLEAVEAVIKEVEQ